MSERIEHRENIEEALAQSLKALVVRMPFEKITIKQITDGAGVIRVTFYNHFQDKYDLLGWIIRSEILAPVRILIENRMFREAIQLIFSGLLRDREFYAAASRIEGQNSFEDIVRDCIYELLLSLFTDHARRVHPKYAWLTPAYMAQYYAQSMTFVVLSWIREGMPLGPEEMGEIYEHMATRSMADVLEEL